MNTSNWIPWLILITGFMLGAFTTFVPFFPGSVLIALAVSIFHWLQPEIFGGWVIVVIWSLAIFAVIADTIAGVLGAKLGGATRYGLIGAAIGGAIGTFFGIHGMIFGPFLGAILGDLFGNRTQVIALLRSGLGAASGFLLGFITRIVVLAAQALVVAIALF